MMPTDAAGFALLALHDRRFVSAVLRTLTGHPTDDERDALPPAAPGESLLAWACRCRPSRPGSPGVDARTLAKDAEAQIVRATRAGILPIALSDPRYPPLLASTSDAPPMLFVKGDVSALAAPAVALVGSRAATPYALTVAGRLAADLAAAGFVVVSGLARGVDSAAHAAALQVKGRTVGVLGCGVDRVYPPEHAQLARNIAHAGAVISELPLGVPPRPHHFPLRNRIISGLSSAVVVVEAPEKSGALITASAALEQGRDVLVVPGPVTGGRNRGGHLLLRDGAKPVESADDILLEVGATTETRAAALQAQPMGQLPENAEFTVDEVATRTGEPPDVVLARLLTLELSGRIQRVGGGRFVRVLT